jgi:hypothetical protein
VFELSAVWGIYLRLAEKFQGEVYVRDSMVRGDGKPHNFPCDWKKNRNSAFTMESRRNNLFTMLKKLGVAVEPQDKTWFRNSKYA